MERRRVLAGLATGLTGLAGCLDGLPTSGPGTETPPTTDAPPTTSGALPRGEDGFPDTICEQDVIEDTGIRAIVDPAFDTDWTGYETRQRYRKRGAELDGPLADDTTVIGIETDGDARAYPVPVLWVHEIVNDDPGVPLLVTFCSLCATGMVAERLVRGEPAIFGVSGQLWRPPDIFAQAAVLDNQTFGVRSRASNGTVDTDVRVSGNLVMYDEPTRSFWSQFLGRAICGPMTGTTLPLVPTRRTTWGDWRTEHPDGDVLLPPPHSTVM